MKCQRQRKVDHESGSIYKLSHGIASLLAWSDMIFAENYTMMFWRLPSYTIYNKK